MLMTLFWFEVHLFYTRRRWINQSRAESAQASSHFHCKSVQQAGRSEIETYVKPAWKVHSKWNLLVVFTYAKTDSVIMKALALVLVVVCIVEGKCAIWIVCMFLAVDGCVFPAWPTLLPLASRVSVPFRNQQTAVTFCTACPFLHLVYFEPQPFQDMHIHDNPFMTTRTLWIQ